MINLDFLYNKNHYEDNLQQNHFYDKKLHFRIIEQGTILPHKNLNDVAFGFGGVVDSRNNFLESSFVHNWEDRAYTPNEEIKISQQTVIYLGMFVGVWGHGITDHLKFVWFLNSEVYKKNFKDYPIVYIPWLHPMTGGGGILSNLTKLLQILEIDPSKLIPITVPTKFQNIILPDESFLSVENKLVFTSEYRETIDRIRNFALKNFNAISQKKIYFLHGRYQIGEERLAEYFKSKGYEIIRPEVLPLEEQLNILVNCTDFVSTVGSCAHNMIFMQNNSNVMLIPRSLADSPYQLPLNQIHPMNITYIDSALSLFQKGSYGPFCYIISKQLKNFFGDDSADEYTEEDFITFLQYVRASMSNGFQENLKLRKYYSGILAEFYSQLVQRKDLMEKFGVFIK